MSSTMLIKNARLYAPASLGMKDILIGGERILAISDHIESNSTFNEIWDAEGKMVTPGFIDQHIHVLGAGGKHGFHSMTPEIKASELVSCGTTTAVGLLGTDGTARSIKSLYAKVKALEFQGLSTYMYTGYYGLDPVHITGNVQEEMIFIDKVLGCKIAIADVRSSYPSDIELLRLLREVRVGGMVARKKGILHLHLGKLETKMDVLFKIVKEHEFPIEHISPTHVGRTKDLFLQAIEFAKLGGMIDITTGASKYTDPWKSVLFAMEQGVPIEKMTFSSDGNAGLDRLDDNKNFVGFSRAPIHKNLGEVISLIKNGGVPPEEAFKIITTNPATNMGVKHKGRVEVGCDADLCCFDSEFNLTDVFARGKQYMSDSKILMEDPFGSFIQQSQEV